MAIPSRILAVIVVALAITTLSMSLGLMQLLFPFGVWNNPLHTDAQPLLCSDVSNREGESPSIEVLNVTESGQIRHPPTGSSYQSHECVAYVVPQGNGSFVEISFEFFDVEFGFDFTSFYSDVTVDIASGTISTWVVG